MRYTNIASRLVGNECRAHAVKNRGDPNVYKSQGYPVWRRLAAAIVAVAAPRLCPVTTSLYVGLAFTALAIAATKAFWISSHAELNPEWTRQPTARWQSQHCLFRMCSELSETISWVDKTLFRVNEYKGRFWVILESLTHETSTHESIPVRKFCSVISTYLQSCMPSVGNQSLSRRTQCQSNL